jgi:hypothetical protein
VAVVPPVQVQLVLRVRLVQLVLLVPLVRLGRLVPPVAPQHPRERPFSW